MRKFETGATRDGDESKLDFWGFESSLADEAFAAYMHKHRKQPDGSMRGSDNWKLGIPLDSYQRSMYRHMKEFKAAIEDGREDDALEIAQALRFNVQGWTHEFVKLRQGNANTELGYVGTTQAGPSGQSGEVGQLSYPDNVPGAVRWIQGQK